MLRQQQVALVFGQARLLGVGDVAEHLVRARGDDAHQFVGTRHSAFNPGDGLVVRRAAGVAVAVIQVLGEEAAFGAIAVKVVTHEGVGAVIAGDVRAVTARG